MCIGPMGCSGQVAAPSDPWFCCSLLRVRQSTMVKFQPQTVLFFVLFVDLFAVAVVLPLIPQYAKELGVQASLYGLLVRAHALSCSLLSIALQDPHLICGFLWCDRDQCMVWPRYWARL